MIIDVSQNRSASPRTWLAPGCTRLREDKGCKGRGRTRHTYWQRKHKAGSLRYGEPKAPRSCMNTRTWDVQPSRHRQGSPSYAACQALSEINLLWSPGLDASVLFPTSAVMQTRLANSTLLLTMHIHETSQPLQDIMYKHGTCRRIMQALQKLRRTRAATATRGRHQNARLAAPPA
jgi:hypothetical protein